MRILSDLHKFGQDVFKVESPNAEVTWKWYDQSQGLVEWTYTNKGAEQVSVVLLRNSYYFGGAFWPVYVANPQFNTHWLSSITPLVDQGVENNSPPLAIGNFSGKYSVCFVFTLAPGQSWSMLEGGFSQLMTPSQASLWEVTEEYSGAMCVGYDNTRVIDWDMQTGTTLKGYSHNPSTVSTVLFNCGTAPQDFLPFNDKITQGACVASPTPDCGKLLAKAESDFASGNTTQGIKDLLATIDCYLGMSTSDVKSKLKSDIEKLVSKL